MTLLVSGLTDTGAVRKSNQDAIDWCVDDASNQALLVVADGMGGYQGGEEASRIAVDTVMEVLGPCLSEAEAPDTRERLVQSALDLASERIEARKGEAPDLAKMGTTIVLAWVTGKQALVAHLGDSRCYLVQNQTLQCLTRDDTVVQNMLEDGSIKERDVPNVPFRNVLTRALGASDASATFSEVSLETGDHLLLCSDGLTGALDENAWLQLMSTSDSIQSSVAALVRASLEQGAKDNVSVVLLSTN
ncbi:PP2C family protein-serine/threonine phosphatase [Marinobacter confluentis]|uniref:Serine/threonine-protein phosphatase n=1 Tax=Marinobacter confluentis TaxID=1697557 RepID=A0A4Z1C1M4_9GAMM|nr:protein phosphatase 2C domain-containing protein [Marinobacter confluentis]TGN41128.1 serine/threonine-protein phosphatase [Marinobacter confluentis]